jgi:thiopurine S-methyltransferase
MESDFWLERWDRNEIGFHQASFNSRLQKFWSELDLDADAAVFVPLCGKTLDMHWLHQQGHGVYGIELSADAIQAFFEEAGIESKMSITFTGMEVHTAPGYTLYRGDFFDLSAPELPGCMGVFDRGALVALPPDLRAVYADHIQRILPDHARILLLTFEYDQSLVSGPPFCVPEHEVNDLFGERCTIRILERETRQELPPPFVARGLTEGTETVYLLDKQT